LRMPARSGPHERWSSCASRSIATW
jgi:hypothetical protein